MTASSVRVGHEVGRDVALVEAHALDQTTCRRSGSPHGMTPSLPTVMASRSWRRSPRGGRDRGDLGDLVLVVGVLGLVLMDSTAASTAASMPFFRLIGLAPAATLRPSRTIDHASTVAVVVPSPATSSVFLATSLTSRPDLLVRVLQVDLLGDGDPVVGDGGAPHFFSSTTPALRAERDGRRRRLVHARLQSDEPARRAHIFGISVLR